LTIINFDVVEAGVEHADLPNFSNGLRYIKFGGATGGPPTLKFAISF